MVDSGIKVNADALSEFTEKLTKLSKRKSDYMIFGIEQKEGKKFEEVVLKDQVDLGASVEKLGDMDLKGVPPIWYAFVDRLAQDSAEAKFGVSYLEYTTKDGRNVSKLFFVFWCSDDCNTKQKMKFSSTKETLIRSLNTAMVKVQASEKDDLDYKEMIIKAEK